MNVDQWIANRLRELRRQWLAAIDDHKEPSVIRAAEAALRELLDVWRAETSH